MVFDVTGKINKKLAFYIYDEIESSIQKPTEVELIIDSIGGDAQYGIFLYEYLRSLAEKGIKTKASILSKCCSAALILFCGAQERIAFPSSEFLMHPIRVALADDTLENLQITLNSYRTYEEMCYEILSSVSDYSKTDWRNKTFGEFYFCGNDAYKMGVVTELR